MAPQSDGNLTASLTKRTRVALRLLMLPRSDASAHRNGLSRGKLKTVCKRAELRKHLCRCSEATVSCDAPG